MSDPAPEVPGRPMCLQFFALPYPGCLVAVVYRDVATARKEQALRLAPPFLAWLVSLVLMGKGMWARLPAPVDPDVFRTAVLAFDSPDAAARDAAGRTLDALGFDVCPMYRVEARA